MEELLAWTRACTIGQGAVLSLAVNALVFAAALAVGAAIVRVFPKRRVADVPPPVSSEEIALATSCIALNSLVMFGGWLLYRAGVVTVDGAASPWRWLVDAAILTLVMDLAMYVTHRAAHVPIVFRWVHGVHHRYDHPRPLTLFVLHPIEVLGFGALWVAVLCLHGFSLGGMLLYLTLNTTFGVLGHVGVEPLPTAWVRWPLLRFIGTSTFHARHHQRPGTNYGFYTATWDRLFGTLDASYETDFGAPPRT